MTAETILVLVLGLVNIGLWILFFLFFRSRFSPSHILREIRIEVDKLVTEISRETDRDIALIEGRIRGLKSLIEEADKRILLAERETRRRSADDKIYAEIASDVPAVPIVPLGEALSRYRKTVKAEPSAQNETVSPTESVFVNTEVSASQNIPEEMPEMIHAPQQVTPKIPVREQVIYLARTGFPAEMIAEQLSLTVSEVELTIALYAGEV